MKHLFLILLLLNVLIPISSGFAQNPAPVIDTLDIEIWPDYDRPSVLVLLTGILPEDTRMPASVTLPLPETAQLNAVARIDSKDDNMKDDIFSSTDPSGNLTFITPDLRFRVEYYLPYIVNNNRRSFDYTWLAAISVKKMQLRVQRPKAAGSLDTDPATVNISSRRDGFDYHTFPMRAVPAGQSFSLRVDYTMTLAQLSTNILPPVNNSIQTPVTPRNGAVINWALVAVVAGSLLLLAAVVWHLASRRSAPDLREPVDQRVEKQSEAIFCRNCGEPVVESDRFCSACGSEL